MAPPLSDCTVFHTLIPQATPCPICGWRTVPDPEPFESPISRGLNPAPAPAVVATQAQITPVTAITVSNLRNTLGSGNGHRNPQNATNAAATAVLPSTLFQVRVAQGYRLKPKCVGVEAPMTFQVFGDLWPVPIANHVPVRHPDLIDTFIAEGQAQRLVHLNAVLSPTPLGSWRLAANHLDPKTPIPRLWRPWEGAILIGDALRAAAYPPPSKKAGARRTYEVTLLWLPPRPEDLIPDQISGLPSEPASSRRGSLETLESFDLRALITQTTPNPAPKQTSHKRQISEAIPRNERLNSPETAPAAALEQGPEHAQEDTQEEEEAAGTGPRKSGRARRPKQRN
jgi:hypothetical protein